MEISYLIDIILFFAFAIASGFFSGTETAFFALSQVDLAKFRKDQTTNAERVVKLMTDSRRLLITILIGNTVVNICAATIATVITIKLSRDFQFSETLALSLEVIIVTLFLLTFSEILPKIIAVRNSQSYALRVSFIIEIFYIIFYPVSTALANLTKLFTRLLKVSAKKTQFSEEEIKTLIELGEEQGAIHEEEKEMIDSIFEFGETYAREIMVPRIDMVCLEVHATIDDLIKIIREKGHSRIPVYEDRIDNIKGIIHAKDLIPILESKSEEINLPELARPAYFVPESKKIDDLLREFQKEKTHMAIVVDEYGGTAGLVTLEDVIEEIVGEIQDEYDKELPLYRVIDERTFIMDGRISIEELNDILPEPLPIAEEEDYETLGGLIYHVTGSVPNINDKIHYFNYDFVIENVERQRIKKVKVIKVDGQRKTGTQSD